MTWLPCVGSASSDIGAGTGKKDCTAVGSGGGSGYRVLQSALGMPAVQVAWPEPQE